MGALNSQSIADYITSLENKVDEWKERTLFYQKKNYKYKQKHKRDADLKEQMKGEIYRLRNQVEQLQKGDDFPEVERLAEENEKLKSEINSLLKNKKNKYRYTAYIQHAGRSMSVGTYNTQEEAEQAEKRAIKAL